MIQSFTPQKLEQAYQKAPPVAIYPSAVEKVSPFYCIRDNSSKK
jgi:hypothetical protein